LNVYIANGSQSYQPHLRKDGKRDEKEMEVPTYIDEGEGILLQDTMLD